MPKDLPKMSHSAISTAESALIRTAPPRQYASLYRS